MKKRILCSILASLLLFISGCSSEFDRVSDVLTEKAIESTLNSLNELVGETTQDSEANSEVLLQEAVVKSIVDGDTIWAYVDEEEVKIRLIGINTPESVHADEEKNTYEGELASIHTKELLKEGDTVYLEYDKELQDQYGRTLAYVWLSEDTSNIQNMLNAKILSDGYAELMFYEPNVKYKQEFERIMKE